jgi:hypothetical protein
VLWVVEGYFEDGWAPIVEDVAESRDEGRKNLKDVRRDYPEVDARLVRYEAVNRSKS